jgi:hypothetical protein
VAEGPDLALIKLENRSGSVGLSSGKKKLWVRLERHHNTPGKEIVKPGFASLAGAGEPPIIFDRSSLDSKEEHNRRKVRFP